MRWALALALLLGAGVASGAPSEARRKAEAQRLVREGRALFERHEFEPARAKFEEAYRLFPLPKMLYNLGLDYQALHHDDRALCALQRLLDEAPDLEPPLRAEVLEHVTKLAARVGRIAIEAPPSTTVTVDGEPRLPGGPEWAPGRPICALAGRRQLVATKPGVLPVRLAVEVKAGEVARVELDPAWNTARELPAANASANAVPAAALAVAPAPSEKPLWKRWWPWAAAGAVVVAGVAIGVGVGERPVDVAAPRADFGPFAVLGR